MSKTKQKSMEELLEEALVPEEEQPYQVPENWVWVKLTTGFAECLDKYRKPVNADEREKRKGNIPYYGATGQVGWIDDYLTDDELVLVGEDGAPFFDPFKNKAYMIRGKAWVNNHAHILKSYYGTYGNQYLLHYLNQFNYHGYVSGSTRLKLTQKKLSEIPIPLPPLSEQKRIAEKVERLLAKIDEAKRLIEEVKESFELRRAAILDKAFKGELSRANIEVQFSENSTNCPHLVPKNWSWSPLENIVVFENGDRSSAYPKKAEIVEDGIPFISTKDLNGDVIRFSNETQFITEDKFNTLRSGKLKENDIVMSLRGSVGKVGIFKSNEKYHTGFINAQLVIVRCLEYVNPEFLLAYFQSETFKALIDQKVTGSAQPQLSVKELKNVLCPMPPLDEQLEIIEKIKVLFNKMKKEELIINTLNEKLNEIKGAILVKAFSGLLGTNDPTDENAIELLKEVLKSK
jgi:type I restriction enzyme, S subunit